MLILFSLLLFRMKARTTKKAVRPRSTRVPYTEAVSRYTSMNYRRKVKSIRPNKNSSSLLFRFSIDFVDFFDGSLSCSFRSRDKQSVSLAYLPGINGLVSSRVCLVFFMFSIKKILMSASKS